MYKKSKKWQFVAVKDESKIGKLAKIYSIYFVASITELGAFSEETLMFRGGSRTYYNCTPRISDAKSDNELRKGLSFFNSYKNNFFKKKNSFVVTTIEKVDRNQFLKAVVDGNHVSIQPKDYPNDKDSILRWGQHKEKFLDSKNNVINNEDYTGDIPLLTGEVFKITVRETRKELDKLNLF